MLKKALLVSIAILIMVVIFYSSFLSTEKDGYLFKSILTLILVIIATNYCLILAYNPNTIKHSVESAKTLGFALTPALIFGILIEYNNLEKIHIFWLSILVSFFTIMLILSYYEESRNKVFLFGLDNRKFVLKIKKHLKENAKPIIIREDEEKKFSFCNISKNFIDVFLKNLLPATVIYILIESLDNDSTSLIKFNDDYTLELYYVLLFSIATFLLLILIKMGEFNQSQYSRTKCSLMTVISVFTILGFIYFLWIHY